ncbi:DUF2382 domain-containing protein [Pseudonocardia sp. HH130630-07]|uniref:DUF2382 domain-containing protein n=1 Tax=Pseudonocardia sp. HH130630-07 TaxID=1690815 RepID=UPI0008151534|nr:PRC and DUF2382 domain-containing protein [Pseudonocardia sp. HH130630-07]ANY07659.1 hypothetical protein AFB00_16680 [Pseudonocardia sp. HH130630-07]
MISNDMTRDLIGKQAVDNHGEKVGKIGQVYLDERTGAPTWATVNTGLFGTKESFVPLDGAGMGDGGRDGAVQLAVEKQKVKDCPHVGRSDERLSGSDESELHRHYGVPSQRGREGDRRADARDTDRDRRGSGDDAMVRHEERLRVGTESEEAGRVALRKYVVTEDQTVTVPVSHEEVRLEREPVAEGTKAGRGAMKDEDYEVTLHRERAVVGKETEAVEKVRLDTRTVTEDERVSDTVRKEQIDVDDPSRALGRDDRR